MVELFCDAVRYSRDLEFMQRSLPAVLRVGQYLIDSYAKAVRALPEADPRHGLIFGPAEHDTCDMGMGSSSPIVDGQYMLYYYSVSMWHWRGMVELGRLLDAFPQVHQNSSFAAELLRTAGRLKADIDASLLASVGRDSSGQVTFVPSCAIPHGTTAPPFESMTQDVVASYSNFRYYSEMLSSGFLSDELAVALMSFRETHGGCLSGMTRYADHLDDMPAIGYAISSLEKDRTGQFLLQLYGHAANYHGRGSFFSTEQASLYAEQTEPGSLPAWRASLGELQADFCVPSQCLIASMTAMQVVFGERDTRTVWLARAAPRRWYSPAAGGLAVERAPTRYGNVSFTISALPVPGCFDRVGACVLNAEIRADFTLPLGSSAAGPPAIRMRVRDPLGTGRKMEGRALSPADCSVSNVDPDQELLTILPLSEVTSSCRIVAMYS